MTTTDAAGSTPPDADAQRRRIEELGRRRAAGTRKPTVVPGAGRRSRAHPARNARIGAVGAGLTTMLGLIAAMGSSVASGGAATVASAGAATVASAGAATVAPVSGPGPLVVTIEKSAPAVSPGATAATSASPVQTSTSPIALTARPTVRQVAPTTTVASTHGSR